MTDTQMNEAVTFGDRRRAPPGDGAIGDISPWDILRGIWARKEIIVAVYHAASMALVLFWLATRNTDLYRRSYASCFRRAAGALDAIDTDLTTAPCPVNRPVQGEVQVMTSRLPAARLIEDANRGLPPVRNSTGRPCPVPDSSGASRSPSAGDRD